MGSFYQFIKFRKEDYELMKQYYPDSSVIEKWIYCWKKYKYQKDYNFAHLEFFCLHLGEKTKAEVAELYPRKLQADLYLKVNEKSLWALTKDKFASYHRLKEFYKRRVCGYNPSPNEFVKHVYEHYDWKTDVIDFLRCHDRFIIKPLAESCGHGVRIFKIETGATPEETLKNILADYSGGFVLEELIHQDDTLARYHEASVNTLRVNVFNSSCYAMGGGRCSIPLLQSWSS